MMGKVPDRDRSRRQISRPSSLRQVDVQDHQIGQRPGQRLPRRRPIVERFGAIALFAERQTHQLANRLLVFDDRNQARTGGHRFDCNRSRAAGDCLSTATICLRISLLLTSGCSPPAVYSKVGQEDR